MSSKYYGKQTNRVADTGGAVRVTIASNVGQGNGGTSLPCKGCYVCAQAGNTGVVVINIGAAASANLGMEVPESTANAIFIPIDDVANLYFYATNDNDVVDILYLK